MKKLLSILTLLVVAVTGVWGADFVTFTTSSSGPSFPMSVGGVKLTQNGDFNVKNQTGGALDISTEISLPSSKVYMISFKGSALLDIDAGEGKKITSVTIFAGRNSSGNASSQFGHGGFSTDKTSWSEISALSAKGYDYGTKITVTPMGNYRYYSFGRGKLGSVAPESNAEARIYKVVVSVESNTPTLTGAWKIGDEEVTGAELIKGADAPTVPTFIVGATSGTPDADDYTVAYSLKEGSTAGIFTFTENGGITAISTATAGTATMVATLSSAHIEDFLDANPNTFEYTVTVSDAAAPTFTSVTPSATNVLKGTASTITAVVEGNPDPTVTWYSCDDAEKTNSVEAGTGLVLNLTNDAMGTFYYYAVATNGVSPDATSDVQTITVTGKTDCKLYEAKYSNGFNAFINEGAKTVTVYYLADEEAPTVTGTPDVSADATYDVSDPTKIVVTAEDGTTKATYAVTRTAVTPYNGDGVEFDGSETWIKTGNAYVTTTGTGDNVKTYYAWVINRQLKDSENRDDDARVALGKTRIYFFVDGAHSIRLYNEKGSSLSYDRKIKVYVNGELQESPTSMGAWKSDTKPSITIAAGNVPAMIEISSDQNSGDTGWGRIEVIKNKSVEVTDAKWATTTTPNWPVSFDENANVYVVTSIGGSIQLTQIAEAPANTPVIVNAAAGSYTMTPKASAAAIATNLLTSATGTETGNGLGNYYVLGTTTKGVGFGKLADGVKLAKGKAYIDGSEFVDAKDFYPFVIGDEENETTSINSIENSELRIENSDYIYNLAGQKVSKDYKGIVIVNGKKVIRK